LQISGLLDHAERYHGQAEIVSGRPEASIHRKTWRTARPGAA